MAEYTVYIENSKMIIHNLTTGKRASGIVQKLEHTISIAYKAPGHEKPTLLKLHKLDLGTAPIEITVTIEGEDLVEQLNEIP